MNRFEKLDKIFNNYFSSILEELKRDGYNVAKDNAKTFIQNHYLNSFKNLDELYSGIFSKDEEIYLIAKETSISRLLLSDLASFKELDKIFSNRLSKEFNFLKDEAKKRLPQSIRDYLLETSRDIYNFENIPISHRDYVNGLTEIFGKDFEDIYYKTENELLPQLKDKFKKALSFVDNRTVRIINEKTGNTFYKDKDLRLIIKNEFIKRLNHSIINVREFNQIFNNELGNDSDVYEVIKNKAFVYLDQGNLDYLLDLDMLLNYRLREDKDIVNAARDLSIHYLAFEYSKFIKLDNIFDSIFSKDASVYIAAYHNVRKRAIEFLSFGDLVDFSTLDRNFHGKLNQEKDKLLEEAYPEAIINAAKYISDGNMKFFTILDNLFYKKLSQEEEVYKVAREKAAKYLKMGETELFDRLDTVFFYKFRGDPEFEKLFNGSIPMTSITPMTTKKDNTIHLKPINTQQTQQTTQQIQDKLSWYSNYKVVEAIKKY